MNCSVGGRDGHRAGVGLAFDAERGAEIFESHPAGSRASSRAKARVSFKSSIASDFPVYFSAIFSSAPATRVNRFGYAAIFSTASTNRVKSMIIDHNAR